MDTLAESAGTLDAAESPARPLVLVAAAALSVQDGAAVVLLRPEGEPGGASDASWLLPRRPPAREETLLEAAGRELARCGLPSPLHLEQLHTRETAAPHAERLVEVAYLALVSTAALRNPPEGGRWWPVHRLPPVLPGHGDLVTAAVRRLRSLLWHTNAGGCLLPEEFTLSELQALYEAVEGRPLDKRNFRKWVLANHLVDPTPRERRDGAHRPARLYCFRSRELVTPD